MAQRGLRLHPPRPQADEPVGQLLGRGQQRRLADAGLTLDHQGAGHPAAGRLQQLPDAAQLLGAAHQPAQTF